MHRQMDNVAQPVNGNNPAANRHVLEFSCIMCASYRDLWYRSSRVVYNTSPSLVLHTRTPGLWHHWRGPSISVALTTLPPARHRMSARQNGRNEGSQGYNMCCWVVGRIQLYSCAVINLKGKKSSPIGIWPLVQRMQKLPGTAGIK